MKKRIRILVVGCGHMGTSHARAYQKMPDFEIVGVVSRGADSRDRLVRELGGGVAAFDSFERAMAETKPEAVSINTYPDTHAPFASQALDAGAHVFVEKPLAETVPAARAIVDLAGRTGRKVVIGYILRHHDSWIRFVELARTLGTPLVMRMNLNQQSSGAEWATHKQLLQSLSPIVDCGVHYVDIMCQITRSPPIRVHAIGARLTDEIRPEMYNYGQLQVVFADGSVGWYEAGWGPMMSETAYFVKDVIGPNGSVSIVSPDVGRSADVASHTKTNLLRLHHSRLAASGEFATKDELLDMTSEPSHQELCDREQAFFLKAIRENLDLAEHWEDAVKSLQIVLAADQSVRTGRVVSL